MKNCIFLKKFFGSKKKNGQKFLSIFENFRGKLEKFFNVFLSLHKYKNVYIINYLYSNNVFVLLENCIIRKINFYLKSYILVY